MNITISGTPGSGKSAIAAELARRGYKTVGVVRMQELADDSGFDAKHDRALMGKPIIHSSLDQFDIMFRHRMMTEEEGKGYSIQNVEEAILSYISGRESASTSEVARAAGVSAKTARGYINRLVDAGTIEAIGTLNSPRRRYRISR